MTDIMHPVPFEELLSRMTQELRLHGSLFNIPYDQIYHAGGGKSITIFGQKAETPLGPAAGPHTQLAQNIITSYLVGGRFIELKTAQERDDFALTGAVAKPCIDARDEGYNVEWSTELMLKQTFGEYAKAYIICCLLDALLHKGPWEKHFIFNLSVGYTLEGIKTEKMQTYIRSMLDARLDSCWQKWLDELSVLLEEGDLFVGTPWEGKEKSLKGLVSQIDPHIVNNVTVSTMHGCPPGEIKAICSYMLSDLHIHTYVKLNPTLLGYEKAREILDANGFGYITLTHENFDHDLHYDDAVAMLHELVDLAKKEGVEFGVKLTNTLGSVNDQKVLPGGEMYMSGRALLPLSATLAASLSREFEGMLAISYCGGVTLMSAPLLFACGLKPLTIATDMLHPGGYGKMTQIAKVLEKEKGWESRKVDVPSLEAFSQEARSGKMSFLSKEQHGSRSTKVGMKLPLTDCYIAPCQMACPIHQPIPEYVQLVAEGRYSDALALIYNTNALPAITSWICDHQCQEHCARNEYEGPVQIREMKRLAWENGFADFKKEWEGATERSDVKAAVVGAGPAGLSAAYFLARAGFDTHLYEKEKDAGGVVSHVIPSFRIPSSVIQQDIDFIAAHGVTFHFGAKDEEERVDALKRAGFSYVFYALGATSSRPLAIASKQVKSAWRFLSDFHENPDVSLGRHVLVIGGGNTAMDAARAARRSKGVEDVTIVYRRSKSEMPASGDELELAMEEGVKVCFLANPVALEDGVATLAVMTLGSPDASGRRTPIDSGKRISLPCDTMLTALGEKADEDVLSFLGLPLTEKGWPVSDPETRRTPIAGVYAIGDMQSGPSVVVKCIASAQAAVDDAIDDVLGSSAESEEHQHHHCDDPDCHHHDHEEEEELTGEEEEKLTKEEDEYFSTLYGKKTKMLESRMKGDKLFASTEGKRCMECSYYCNKCVDVCPNRANVAIDVRSLGMFENPFQIVHLDAYCNECGNCETFCPYDGGPYKEKFTIFSDKASFEESKNSGFCQDEGEILIRQEGKIYHASFDRDGNLGGDEGVSEEVAALVTVIFETYSYLLGPVE